MNREHTLETLYHEISAVLQYMDFEHPCFRALSKAEEAIEAYLNQGSIDRSRPCIVLSEDKYFKLYIEIANPYFVWLWLNKRRFPVMNIEGRWVFKYSAQYGEPEYINKKKVIEAIEQVKIDHPEYFQ